MMTMVISGSDGVTFPDSTNQFSGGAFSFKNRILNGDMRIDQRNAGAAVTSGGSYAVDRFRINHSTDGAFSGQQDSSVPAGFNNSLKITTTTADATLTGSQGLNVQQRIEGFNVADLGWGTANSKTVTLSFWVRSSLTGTFGGALRNSAVDRSYAFTYAISVADTWEYKTVTVVGDTTGTWLTDNGIGIYVIFGLGSGPDTTGTANAWAAANYVQPTSTVSVIGTLNATWYVTGVQFEVGSVATPFERRPYGTELALCQRYYYKIGPGPNGARIMSGFSVNTTLSDLVFALPVPMRDAPSALEQSGTAADYNLSYDSTNANCSSVPTYQTSSNISAGVRYTVASGLTQGRGAIGRLNTDGYLGWSAEL